MADQEAEADGVVAQLGTLGDEVAQTQNVTTESQNLLIELSGHLHSHGKALGELLQLVWKETDLKHEEALIENDEHKNDLAKLITTIRQKELRGEDCDAQRAQIIVNKAALKQISVKLNDCLKTKKELSIKITASTRFTEIAQAGLERCLDNKEKLTAAVLNCHTRRDLTRKKLKECLDRKIVLKEQIHACHTKRDEARGKLRKCLAAKAKLKEKILEMKAKQNKAAALEQVDVAEIDGNSESTLEAELEAEHQIMLEVNGLMKTLNDNFDAAAELNHAAAHDLTALSADTANANQEFQKLADTASAESQKSQKDVERLLNKAKSGLDEAVSANQEGKQQDEGAADIADRAGSLA